MSNDLNFYINGEWVKSESNETIDVINPANEEVIGQVTAGTKEDIDKAVDFYKKAVALNPTLIDYFENKRRRLKEAGLWNSDNERESS